MKKEKKVEENIRICSRLLMSLMIVCVTLSIATLGIVIYDKFINTDDKIEHAVLKPIEGKIEDNTVNIKSLKEIVITNNNQTVKVGNKELKIRKDENDTLFVNDIKIPDDYVIPEKAYVTDKFVIFENFGQCSYGINYAVDENGSKLVVNTNGYQLDNLRLSNGVLYGDGVSCTGEPYPTSKVMIKYVDHTLIVTKAN